MYSPSMAAHLALRSGRIVFGPRAGRSGLVDGAPGPTTGCRIRWIDHAGAQLVGRASEARAPVGRITSRSLRAVLLDQLGHSVVIDAPWPTGVGLAIEPVHRRLQQPDGERQLAGGVTVDRPEPSFARSAHWSAARPPARKVCARSATGSAIPFHAPHAPGQFEARYDRPQSAFRSARRTQASSFPRIANHVLELYEEAVTNGTLVSCGGSVGRNV